MALPPLGSWLTSGANHVQILVDGERRDVSGQIFSNENGWSGVNKQTESILRFENLHTNHAYLVRLFTGDDIPSTDEGFYFLLVATKPPAPLLTSFAPSTSNYDDQGRRYVEETKNDPASDTTEEAETNTLSASWRPLRTNQVTHKSITKVIVKYSIVVSRVDPDGESGQERTQNTQIIPAGIRNESIFQLTKQSDGLEVFDIYLQVSLHPKCNDSSLNFGPPGIPMKRNEHSERILHVLPPALPMLVRGSTTSLEFKWPRHVHKSILRWCEKNEEIASLPFYIDIGLDARSHGATATYPVVFPPNMGLGYSKMTDIPDSFTVNNLNAKTWYWLRLRCAQKHEADATSKLLAIETPPGRPTPPSGLHAAFTLYNDEKRQMRHIFVKIDWNASRDNGFPIEEYIVLRSETGRPDDWAVVLRSQNTACVLSGLVSMADFEYKCFFVVRARNQLGMSESVKLPVHIKAKASAEFLTKRELVAQKRNDREQKQAMKEQELLDKTRQLVKDYLNSDLVVTKSSIRNRPVIDSIKIEKIGGPGPIQSPKSPHSPKGPKKNRGASPRSPRIKSPKPGTTWKEPDTPFSLGSASAQEVATHYSTKSSQFPSNAQQPHFNGPSNIPPISNDSSQPHSTTQIQSSRTLTSEVSHLTLSPKPPLGDQGPQHHPFLSPYRQPLSKRSLRAAGARELASPSDNSKQISKAVYREMGLPDFSKLKGVHCEIEVARRLRNKEVEIIWTFGYDESEKQTTEGALVSPEIPIGTLRDPGREFSTTIRTQDATITSTSIKRVRSEEPENFSLDVRVEGNSNIQRQPTGGLRTSQSAVLSMENKTSPNKERSTKAVRFENLPCGDGISSLRKRQATGIPKELMQKPHTPETPDSESGRGKNKRTQELEQQVIVLSSVEDISAVKIQSAFRMKKEKDFVSANKESFLASKERRKIAALKVTAFARMSLARKEFFVTLDEHRQTIAEENQAACIIQKKARALNGRVKERKDSAAIAIQSQYRMRRDQKTVTALKTEKLVVDLAAKKIQNQFRAIESKKAAKKMREVQKKEEDQAARIIQNRIRSRHFQSEFERKKTAAIQIQAKFRSHREYVAFQAKVQAIVIKAAIRLQTRFRGHNARKQLELRKRFQIKSVVRVNVSRCGHREAVGMYETMGVSDAAQYILLVPNSDDSYVIERSTDESTNVPIWTLKWIKGSGETVLLYANKVEGASIRPPRRSWQPVAGKSPVPVLHWKSSESYLNEMSLLHRAAYVITDGGSPEVNGKYVQSGLSDEVPQYLFQKKGFVMMLFRVPYENDTKIWLIAGTKQVELVLGDSASDLSGISEESAEDDSEKQKEKEKERSNQRRNSTTTIRKVFYANVEHGSDDLPPLDGWIVAQNGSDPIPIIVPQNRLQQQGH